MKRITAGLLLFILLLTAALAAMGEEAQTDTPPMPPSSEELLLPDGIWILGSDGNWSFNFQADTQLMPAQAEIAINEDLPVTAEGIIREGTVLSSSDLFKLFPGSESHFNLPQVEPELEMFALSGEWFYGEDDVLYYRHADGYATLTVDEVFAKLHRNGSAASPNEKIIYLTIDDTPSTYTMELLSILDKLNVKATFFVVGAYVKSRPVFVRAMYDQGHVIANHSYSHDAAVLSSSFNNCLYDFRRCEDEVEKALGFRLDIPILRVPYGSSTIPSAYRTELQRLGYMWIDWNALNGDTEKDITSDEAALGRAISTASRHDGSIVMLVHDKKRTVRTMEAMIQYFRDEGYVFRVLEPTMEKIPAVRMGQPI